MPRSPYYDTQHWRSLRAAMLKRRPVCETPRCGKPATMVDHIKPRPRMVAVPTLSDVPGNLQCLCRPCHSAKTARDDGGFGNAPSRRVAIGPDGWPVDG